MTLGRYILGFCALLAVFGSLGAGALALRTMLLGEWRGAAARLAEAVLALGLLVVELELLGTVGLFSAIPIVVVSSAVGFGTRAWVAGRAGERPRRLVRAGFSASEIVAGGFALAVAGVVIAEWAGLSLQSFDSGIVGADSLAYHLPWAASFAQTHQIISIRYTDIEWLTGFYPATSELIHGLGIVLMGSDLLSPGINLVWLALFLLAAWCVGQPRGLGPASMVGGAIALCPPMMFFSTAGSADSDAAAAFFVMAAVALWVNAAPRAEHGSPLKIRFDAHRAGVRELTTTQTLRPIALLPGAIATGLALSVKLNVVGPALLITAGVIVWARPGLRLRVAKVWLLGTAGAGGYWFLRNIVAVGNPLPYFSFGVLPTPSPPPTQAHNNYAITDYLTYPRILKDLFTKALAQGLGPWWVVIVVAAVLGGALCVASGPDRLTRVLGVIALGSIAAYILTPGSASGPWGHPRGFMLNLRYIAPALALAFTATPLAAPLGGRRIRWLVLAGLGAIFTATVALGRLWNGYDLAGQIFTAGLFLLLGLIVVLVPAPRLLRLGPPVRRLALATALVVLVLASAAGGYSGERDYQNGRYTQMGVRSVRAVWLWARSLRHQRIALAGTLGWYFGYPLFGPDDSNRVVYVGHHGPHGAFSLISSCREWREDLNAGHYRYVVTSASRTMWTGALRPSPEGAWTRSDPAAKLLFPSAPKATAAVYELTGKLDPNGCARVSGTG
ncbi:MAG: hypothetical protein ACYC91_12005 [Solirubrobacteraceae bacterium]